MFNLIIEIQNPIRKKFSNESFIPDLTKIVDWSKFSDLISFALINYDNSLSPINNYDIFSKLLIDCSSKSQLKTNNYSPHKKHNPTLWWDNDCSMALKHKSNAFKNFRRSGSRDHYFLYCKTEAQFTRTIKYKKRNYWRTFIENLDSQTSSSTLWTVARNMRNFDASSPIISEYTEDWISQFASKTCPDFVPHYIPFKNTTAYNYFPELCAKLDLAFSNTKNTVPGIDNIKFIILKNLPLEGKLYLLSVYNEFILQNVFPTEWRFIKVVSIIKPGKDPSLVNSRRPISLLSCLRKLMERMLLNRLEFWAEKNNIFSSSQYGLRKGRGSRDCIANE